jgi:hypothetical protein
MVGTGTIVRFWPKADIRSATYVSTQCDALISIKFSVDQMVPTQQFATPSASAAAPVVEARAAGCVDRRSFVPVTANLYKTQRLSLRENMAP